MGKKELGFSVFEIVISLFIVIAVTAIGYKIDKSHQTKTATVNSLSQEPAAKNTASSTQTVPKATTEAKPSTTSTTSISNLLTKQSDDESNIDSQSDSNDQTAATGANSPAANLGDAYNESSF